MPTQLFAQRYTRLIALKVAPSKLKYTPFNRIQVLDNRADTTRFFTYDSARTPVDIKFRRPASQVIKSYFEIAIAPLNKGNHSLLLNIRQLGATNVPIVSHRIGKQKNSFWPDPTGSNLQFAVDAWLQTEEGLYRKIGSANYSPIPTNISTNITADMSGNISWCLNRLLEAVGHIDERRSTHHAQFDYADDTTSVPFGEINKSAIERWQSDPVMQALPSREGFFPSLEDFRDLRMIPYNPKIIYDSKDSVYRSDQSINNRGMSFITDSGNLYVRVDDKIYLKLIRRDGKLSFYVPHSLPDMHDLINIARAEHSYHDGKGNLLIALGGSVAETIADNARINTARKKANAPGGDVNNFRDCFIDLDSGDIIY